MITAQRINELLDDNQSLHSDLQIDRFIILANGLTEYGCYKQALRELHSRFHILLGHWLELEELRLDEADAVELAVDRRGQLSLAKIRLRIMGLESTASETRREFLRFLAHADHLKNIIGELTPEKRAEFEREYWIENIRRLGPEHGSKLASTMPYDDQMAIASGSPKPLPELPVESAEIDVDALLRLTVDERLIPCPALEQS